PAAARSKPSCAKIRSARAAWPRLASSSFEPASAPTTSRAGSRPTLDPRPVVVQPKQRHDRRDVRLVADEVADPSGLREDVMRLRRAEGDELVAHERGEGQVGEPVAVHMAQLAPAVSELSPAEPVPTDRHAGPRRHFPHDGIVNGFAQRLYSI